MSETNPVMITDGGHIPTVLEAMRDFLVAEAGATFNTDLFIGYNKDAPGLVRWLNLQPGQTGQTMGTAVAWEQQTVLLSVRGDKGQYLAPRDEIIRLRYLILTIHDYEAPCGITIHATTSPMSWREMGRDIADREGFQAAIECMVSKSYE